MSIFYSGDHKVQSKYREKWETRQIALDSYEKKILIHDSDGKKIKSFPLEEVRTSTCDKGHLYIHTGAERNYKL